MATSVREQCLAQIETLLQAIPDITVFRNLTSLVKLKEMPAAVVWDGREHVTSSGVLLMMEMDVDLELWATAQTESDLGPAINALHTTVANVLLKNPSLGGVAIDLQYGGMMPPVTDKDEGSAPFIGLIVTYHVTYQMSPIDVTAFGPA